MKVNGFSKKDLYTLLSIINSCNECSNTAELSKIITSCREFFDFDYAAYSLKRERPTGPLITTNSISFPAEWDALYAKKNWHTIDPMLRENFRRFGFQYYEDTLDAYGRPEEMVGIATDFGILTGYAYGVRNYNGTDGSFFGFAGKKIQRHKRIRNVLDIIGPHLHEAVTRLATQGESKQDLEMPTKREFEVLSWLAAGKTSWEISMILHISERTAIYHISNIVRKLDASNRTHAVAIAISNGLLRLD